MGSGRERARGPEGERRIPETQRGPPGADSPAVPGDAAGRRPRASEEVPSPARRHPAGLGPAPRGRGAKGPRDSGAALTHKEAKEVEADEQRPLAAALPRVVVERRAAAVLALRDDRLVVLVVLHGAGCGAILPPREDAPQQRPHTQGRGSLPGRGCSGEWRVGPGLGSGGRREGGFAACFQRRRWCFLLPLGASAFFLSQPQIVRKSKRKGARSRAESFAELRCSGRAGLACAWGSERGSGQRGRSATFLRSWRLNEWELRGARPLRSASPAPTFPPPAAAAAAAAVVIALGLFSALLFHEVL